MGDDEGAVDAMNIGFIFFALISRAPTNMLSDAVPFSIAQSHDEGGIVAYTITGPKVERTRALDFALLGVPWFFGGVVLLFSSHANLTVHPAIAYTVLLGGGGLMLFQAHIRRRAARARTQIEIDTASGRCPLWASPLQPRATPMRGSPPART